MTIKELLNKDYVYFEKLSTNELYKLNRRLQQYIINRNRPLETWDVDGIQTITSSKVRDVTQAHNVYFSRVWRALQSIKKAPTISELRARRIKYRERFDEEELTFRSGDDMRRAYNFFVHDRQARSLLSSEQIYEVVNRFMIEMASDVVRYNMTYEDIINELYQALIDGRLETIRNKILEEKYVII